MPHPKLSPEAWRENVPEALKRLPHWVAHSDKVPSHPVTRRLARVNDPTTWGTFEEAALYYKESAGDPKAGVGYVFTDEDGMVAIDLDYVLDAEQALWLPGSEPVWPWM